ncbi:hypothetical protein Z947_1766 [Sulfitobacter geojensis]|nr:hypothetical protein Z947_1766 [Sulfitobacter geojensis]
MITPLSGVITKQAMLGYCPDFARNCLGNHGTNASTPVTLP